VAVSRPVVPGAACLFHRGPAILVAWA
jgi:hypothetical protein